MSKIEIFCEIDLKKFLVHNIIKMIKFYYYIRGEFYGTCKKYLF